MPSHKTEFEVRKQAAADLIEIIRQDSGISYNILSYIAYVLRTWDGSDVVDSGGVPFYHSIIRASDLIGLHIDRMEAKYHLEIDDIKSVEKEDLLITNVTEIRTVEQGLLAVTKLRYDPDELVLIQPKGRREAQKHRQSEIARLTEEIKRESTLILNSLKRVPKLTSPKLRTLRGLLRLVGVPKAGPHTLAQRRGLRLGKLLQSLPSKDVTDEGDIRIILEGLGGLSDFVVFADTRDAKNRKLQPLLNGDDFRTSSSGDLANELLAGTLAAKEKPKKTQKGSEGTKSNKSTNAELDQFLNTLK